MGTISSGTGLISGLDISSLVSQLMKIESEPLTNLQERIATTQSVQTAYSSISALLLSVQSSISKLTTASAFQARTATSSNTDVLTASATKTAQTGVNTFYVRSLVTTHQLVSGGYATRDSTTIGAGTLSFALGAGKVNEGTSLSALNGFGGIRRGVIRITDHSGASADIDLQSATSLDDVLEAINSQSTANVTASVSGDHLVLTDNTGLTTGSLSVADLSGGYTAADLGIRGSTTDSQLQGSDIMSLTEDTTLSYLNDGNGVRTNGSQSDISVHLRSGESFDVDLSGNLRFTTSLDALNDGRGVRGDTSGERIIRITNRAGTSAEVDLTSAETVQDVVDAIAAADIGITVVSITDSALVLSDSTKATASDLKVEDVTGNAAADLGILGSSSSNSFTGTGVYRINDMGGVLRAFQYATGNNGALEVSIDDNGLVFTDTTTGSDFTWLEGINGSQAAKDLGVDGTTSADGTIRSRDLIAGLNTVLLSSLNGGQGVRTGEISFTKKDGTTATVDLTNAQTLQDVIDGINSVEGLSASVSEGGSGIVIDDTTTGTGQFVIEDQMGWHMVEDLHLEMSSSSQISSGDLHLKYISENTTLDSLNQGSGVSTGSFRITNSLGKTATVQITDKTETMGDVIEKINDLNMGITAQINGDGSGIELIDTAGGTGTLSVAEVSSGTTATSLGILGTADATTNVLTGSFTREIEIDSDDTLDSLVEKINSADLGVSASVINDGTSVTPYRLILTSESSGTAGEIIYSSDVSGLSLGVLQEAQDASVVIGDPSNPNSIVVTSSSNTITNIIDGLTLNLVSVSDEPVQVNIDHDIDSLSSSLESFTSSVNSVLSQIDSLTSYDSETEERGVLFSESTIDIVKQRLLSGVTSAIKESGLSLDQMVDIGFTISDGQLVFDAEEFAAACEEDLDAVTKLFTLTKTDENDETVNLGIAVRLKEILAEMTDSGGLIDRQNDQLQLRVDLFNSRAEDLQTMLDKKEDYLYAKFEAMESALADLQTQQSAISSLSSLISSSSS